MSSVVTTTIAKRLEKYFDYASKKSVKVEGCSDQKLSKPIRQLLVSIIVSMILTRSVVYEDLAEVMNEEVQVASNVRRIYRMMSIYQLNYVQIAVLTSLLLPKGKWELSLDRTNWEYGQSCLNILTVTLWVKGVGVPIWYEMLDNKGGNSSQAVRITIFDKLIKIFGINRIKRVYGDREFIGDKWVRYLLKNKIKFYLRITQDTLVRLPGQLRGRSAYKWMHKKQTRYLNGVEIYDGLKVNIVLKPLNTLKKNGQPDQLLLITNMTANKRAMDSYKRRWSIEVFFQCIKSRGFNLEKTHLTKPERLRKLFAAVCLAFVCCLATGIYKDAKIKKIPLCKHGYKRKSYFRYGLDELRSVLRKASRGQMETLEEFFELLYCDVIRLPDLKQQKAAA